MELVLLLLLSTYQSATPFCPTALILWHSYMGNLEDWVNYNSWGNPGAVEGGSQWVNVTVLCHPGGQFKGVFYMAPQRVQWDSDLGIYNGKWADNEPMNQLSPFPSPTHKYVSDSALRLKQGHTFGKALCKDLPHRSSLSLSPFLSCKSQWPENRNENQILTAVQKKKRKIERYAHSTLLSSQFTPFPNHLHHILVFL